MARNAVAWQLVTLLLVWLRCGPAWGQNAAPFRTWLAQAPPAFHRLIEAGNVQFEYNDVALKEKNKFAMTMFQFTVHQGPRYTYQPAGHSSEGDILVKITTSFPTTSFKVQHRVILPSSFQPNDPWQIAVFRHEFDHVAISTDPRIRKLIEALLWRDQTWTEKYSQVQLPTAAQIEHTIQNRITERQGVLERLVQANYDRLDEVSSNGQKKLEEREKFFNGLYEEKSVESTGIELSDEQRRYLRSAKFRDLGKHYTLLSLP